jgi:hypothetical protein
VQLRRLRRPWRLLVLLPRLLLVLLALPAAGTAPGEQVG